MAGTTANFGLGLMSGGSDDPTPDEVADIKMVNDALKLVDGFLGVKICTSGTRPASPKTQQMIVETDTQKFLYWNGTTWVSIFYPLRGSTGQRDAFWGAYNTAALRVALVAAGATWFNTDIQKLYPERLYAQIGDAGATNPNALVGGWYPQLGSGPKAALRKTSAQTITGAVSAVSWNYEQFKADGTIHANGTNPTRIIVPTAGNYRLSFQCQIQAVTGNGLVTFFVNGVANTNYRDGRQGLTTVGLFLGFSEVVSLQAGDYVEIMLASGTSGALDIAATTCSIEYLFPGQV